MTHIHYRGCQIRPCSIKARLKPSFSPVLVQFWPPHFWSSFDRISGIFGLDRLKNSESDYLILNWPVVASENDNDLPWRLGLSLGPIRVRVKIKSKRFLSVNESEIRIHPKGRDFWVYFSNEFLELALWWPSGGSQIWLWSHKTPTHKWWASPE